MKPEQENMLLKIMSKVGDKLDRQQTRWWTYAGIIYGILIFLIAGLIIEYRNVKENNHDLELRIQKMESRYEFEKEQPFEFIDEADTTNKPEEEPWDSLKTLPKN